MKHLDLFSGIGGFALVVDEVWPGSEHIFCEIDPFCQALLKKRFEGSVIYGDIRELTADAYINGQPRWDTEVNTTNGNKQTFSNAKTSIDSSSLCDILTGGFPCQPFSQAGKRRGTGDNRYLWPEMLRVIRDFKPTWVIAENVRGLLTISEGMVFEQVCLDLEGEGYEVQPFIIPAVAVNAPHRRDRVWIIAHNTKYSRQKGCAKRFQAKQNSNGTKNRLFKQTDCNAPNAKSIRCGGGGSEKYRVPKRIMVKNKQGRNSARSEGQRCVSDVTHAGSAGLQRGKRSRTLCAGETSTHGSTSKRCRNTKWHKNWFEVATELCGVDDGLPAELDGLKFSKSRHRVERLKSLGNSIVPQVAIEIMKAIKETPHEE